jgi:hypothetical protein
LTLSHSTSTPTALVGAATLLSVPVTVCLEEREAFLLGEIVMGKGLALYPPVTTTGQALAVGPGFPWLTVPGGGVSANTQMDIRTKNRTVKDFIS